MKEVIRCKINEKHRQFNNFKTRHSSSTCSAVLLVAGYPPGCSPSCSTQWTDQKRCGAVLFQGSSTKHGKMEGCSLPSNPSRNRKTSWIFQTWSHRLITETKARAQMNRSLVSRLAVEIFSGLRMMRSGLLLLTICLGCRSTDRRDSEKKSRTSPLRSLAVSFQPHNNHQSNWQRLNSNDHQEKTSDSFVMPEETSSTRRYLGTTGAALGRSASAARFVIEGSKSNVAGERLGCYKKPKCCMWECAIVKSNRSWSTWSDWKANMWDLWLKKTCHRHLFHEGHHPSSITTWQNIGFLTLLKALLILQTNLLGENQMIFHNCNYLLKQIRPPTCPPSSVEMAAEGASERVCNTQVQKHDTWMQGNSLICRFWIGLKQIAENQWYLFMLFGVYAGIILQYDTWYHIPRSESETKLPLYGEQLQKILSSGAKSVFRYLMR